MDIILNLILIIVIIQFVHELYSVILRLERHEYIGWSYQHSIQHFAYLSFYLIWTIMLLTSTDYYWIIAFMWLGTIILNYHIREERLGKFK